MLQDRNTNVKVDAWIKQFNEEQKVQDQRIANLEETEKTVQNATCFDGCTSAQWKDYIANNPVTDIETDNFSVHNNTSEIKMGSNVELKSGSSKVDVDSSSVTNETQFTNQFSEVSKAKTEIYSGDDSTHFEAKAECGPEGKSSCIRVSADYSLLNTSTSNTDFGNYYFSNQKAEFTFPSHCFEFCCDGRFLIDGQPSSVTNAICFDGCDATCWRDYIAAQIPAKSQDTYCFDGCDGDCWRSYIASQIPSKAQDTFCFDGCNATCWRDYIDSKSSSSSITSPDGCALVTTTHCTNKIYMCDPNFTFGDCFGALCFDSDRKLIFDVCRSYFCSHCNMFYAIRPSDTRNSFCVSSTSGCLATNIFRATGGCGINCFYSDCCNTIDSKINSLCATSCNCFVAKTENYLCAGKANYISVCRDTWSGDLSDDISNNIMAIDAGETVASIFVGTDLGEAMISLNSNHYNILNAPENCLCGQWCNIIRSKVNCMCARAASGPVQNKMDAWSDSDTGQNYLRAKTNNLLWSEGPNYLQALCNDLQATNRNVLKAASYNQICSGNHCWEFCCDGNLYKDGVCVL